MARTELKWPIAKDADGKYVRIEDARLGDLYQCPQCAARFVARQGSVRAWHFAHHPGSVCTGEGARHDITKHMLAAVLHTIKELPLYCHCQSLPTKPFSVEFTDTHVEEVVDEYRIDVVCRLGAKQLCIEVVDRNPIPDAKRLAFQNGLVEVNISRLTNDQVFKGEKTVDLLKAGLSVALEHLVPAHMLLHSWTGQCWKCGKQRRVATVCGSHWRDRLPPEVIAALQQRSKMEFRHTGGVREGYWANLCPHCNAVQGDFYLIDEMLELLIVSGEDAVEVVFVPLVETRIT